MSAVLGIDVGTTGTKVTAYTPAGVTSLFRSDGTDAGTTSIGTVYNGNWSGAVTNMVDFGGAEAVVYGPGDFSVAHLPSEHVDAGEVLQCAEVFKRLAREAAGW